MDVTNCTDAVERLLMVALTACLLPGCATTAGLLDLGREKPAGNVAGMAADSVAACEAGSEKRPLARWSSLSGELLLRPGGIPPAGAPVSKRLLLITPVAVAALANTLYIVDAGQRAILKFDRGTQTASIFASVPEVNTRAGLYVDRAYTLYLADPVAANVVALDIDGNLLQTFSNATELPQPVAVVTSIEGDEIFVGDDLASHILVFNRGGTVTRSIGSGTNADIQFQSVTAIASGPDQLYVSDRLGHQVHALAPDGTYRFGFGRDELLSPGALAIDRHNRVYVADTGDSTIKVFRGGQLEAVVGAPEDPVGLGFQVISSLWESDGLMYVADAARASIDILRIVPPCN